MRARAGDGAGRQQQQHVQQVGQAQASGRGLTSGRPSASHALTGAAFTDVHRSVMGFVVAPQINVDCRSECLLHHITSEEVIIKLYIYFWNYAGTFLRM
jgi:hypothetical protein